ncbi:MAG: elongation factor G [Candidatus Eisenbacteria bacterium]|nr:elongation factor G [Candidatus Eisenbacteria bacterium]
MKEYDLSHLRNVALVGHGGVGKTSLAEAILFDGGAVSRLGRIADGSTTLDYSADEIERKISINLAVGYCEWKGCKLNVLDSPGYLDFVGEVISALSVADCGLLVVSGHAGVEVGTEKIWNYLGEGSVPTAICVNMMDKEHADFDKTLTQMREMLSPHAVPLVIPTGAAENFHGVVDLMRMKAFLYDSSQGPKVSETNIPKELEAKAKKLREELVEAIAETNDQLLEKFLDGKPLSDEELKNGLRAAVRQRQIFPVFAVSSFQNRGIQSLLDGVVEYMPCAGEVGPIEVKKADGTAIKKEISPTSGLIAFVFKTVSEPHVGELSLFRVFSGNLESGKDVFNSKTGRSEKIGQVYLLQGRERKETARVPAGDIGAAVKLKETSTGHTLCAKEDQVIVQTIDFPDPVHSVAIAPKAKGDEEKISNGLTKLHEEDPTFIVKVNPEIHQTLIYGMGDLHLEVIVDRLKRKFGVGAELMRPLIPYRETIKSKVEKQGRYKRQSGGRGQYGDVWIKIEPLKRGSGFEFEDKVVGGAIPGKYIPAVEKGIVEAMTEGELTGCPVVDLKVTLFDGSYHAVDSSDMAFKIAGSMAFRAAVAEASPVLLEPIDEVEVEVPEEFMGAVTGDLSSKRGKILGMDSAGNSRKIRALVPGAELYKYSTSLRSLTHGRGGYKVSFSHYEEVPRELSERIISAAKESKEKQK